MRDSCYIVLSEAGIERMTKRQGSLRRGEVAVRISLAIKDSCFAQPAISAHIDIPESAVIHPKIDVTIVDPRTGHPLKDQSS